LALDVAQLAQALPEGIDVCAGIGRRHRHQQTHAGDLRGLLGLRSEGPCQSRSGNGEERSAMHYSMT
jgi:hypothetical protein